MATDRSKIGISLDEECSKYTYCSKTGRVSFGDLKPPDRQRLTWRCNVIFNEDDRICFHHEKVYLSLESLQRSCADPFNHRKKHITKKNELNKKVCIHCNTTFPSAVSLSNHLRAYARRKRVALLEGTTYDCKQKKPRSRAGPKKKMFSMPHATDEIYRLTCRFCDLVFQGPLSVQEDWIKHLQRHIMNTSVPHTGAGMVEVTSLPKDPLSPERQTSPLPVTQVQVAL